ncbi:AAA family ATPase, partial [Kitasatospora sp. LaBMicrA B282]|uniref:AAA family ATPase n=1 Tax=Kitasatospora sp. LaBMicrA B282 TaxID=3420949 RepID=UPI003D1275A2
MLIERETELGLLASTLQQGRAGAGSTVVIRGPLGAGRTALVGAIAALAGPLGIRAARAAAAPAEQDFAFGVVRQLLEPVLDGLDGPTGGPAGLPCDDPVPGEPAGVLAALHELTVRLAAAQPLVLLVDDVQWADDPSLEWLGHLARRLRSVAAVLVLTVREGDPAGERAPVRALLAGAEHASSLRPLSPAGTAAVLGGRFGGAVEPGFVRACHRMSGGNPLVLGALLTAVAEAGLTPGAAQVHRLPGLSLPLLRRRVAACLRHQPAAVRAVAKAVALLDGQADADQIGRLAGTDRLDCTRVLDALHRMGLLTEGPRPRPAHPAIRDALEELISLAEREQLHLRAAGILLADGGGVEEVAGQLVAVAAAQGPWAREVLREAADQPGRRR